MLTFLPYHIEDVLLVNETPVVFKENQLGNSLVISPVTSLPFLN